MSIKLLHPRLSTIKKRGCWTSSTFFFFDIIHVLSTFNFPPSTSTFFKMTESHLLLSMTPTCKLTSMVINDTLTAFFFYSASVQGAHMERPLWIWISLNRFNLPEINFPQLMHFFNINEYQWQMKIVPTDAKSSPSPLQQRSWRQFQMEGSNFPMRKSVPPIRTSNKWVRKLLNLLKTNQPSTMKLPILFPLSKSKNLSYLERYFYKWMYFQASNVSKGWNIPFPLLVSHKKYFKIVKK